MNILYNDVLSSYTTLKSEIDESITSVLASGHYILGSYVDSFEHEWSTYCKQNHCVGVASGLDALHLSLLAVGVKPLDRVIVPSYTFFATWLAVLNVGAVPVPVDVDRETHRLDISCLSQFIDTDIKAVITVDLYGNPSNAAAIHELCKSLDIPLIQDAAQAHGALHHGLPPGHHSDLCAWSFYPGKNLGAFGDAGAVTTNNSSYASTLRMLRNYGSSQKYHHDVQGLNSRLDPLQAAVLSVKLRHLDYWTLTRQNIASIYNSVVPNSSRPALNSFDLSSYHIYPILTKNRDLSIQFFSSKGINTLIHYPVAPCDQQAVSGFNFDSCCIKNSILIANSTLSIPLHPFLSDVEIDSIVNALKIFPFYA